ncbi:MAG: heat shock protein HspQ [Sphingomonadales bacterium]
MQETIAKFAVGQIIRHKLFDYRGVIVDVDADFQLNAEWYQKVALTRPPKNRPWYHVLVDGGDRTTYVAERNLQTDRSAKPVAHPLVPAFFTELRNGRYKPVSMHN